MSTSSHARRMSRTKKILITGGAVVTVASGGAAFAYWTSTGTGTGTASSTTPSTVTVTQTSTISALNPGKPAQTLSGTLSLPANSGAAYVTSLTVAVSSVTKASGVTAACDASDYTIGGAATGVPIEVTDAATKNWSGLTIVFNDKSSTNQDGCKGATVNLTYTAS